MQNFFFFLILSITCKLYSLDNSSSTSQFESSFASSEQMDDHQEMAPSKEPIVIKSITPFTGKITKNKVRLRFQPNLESLVVRELQLGDLVVVVGETEEFYAIEPLSDMKAYVFRTFVLDGQIEGNRVNVRLAPQLNAPIIAQMNSGDQLTHAIVAPSDKKWVEFTPPPSTRFYIAKEYINKVGDRFLLSTLKRKKEEITTLLATTSSFIKLEMAKPFDQINIEEATKKLNRAITEYSEFPDEIAKAKNLLNQTQEAYLQKKLAAMEAKVKFISATTPPSAPKNLPTIENQSSPISNKMTVWETIEKQIYEEWAKQEEGAPTMDAFYAAQKENMVTLQGIIEPFNRSVRNKPGDYLLLTQATQVPIAYLYSTKVNLQDKVGQTVVVQALPRDNHSFAFPAYLVIANE